VSRVRTNDPLIGAVKEMAKKNNPESIPEGKRDRGSLGGVHAPLLRGGKNGI